MPFVTLNHIVHCYVDEGARGKLAIVFANSLGSDLRIWDDVAARLVSDFRVVRYDFRGHGLTEAPAPPYSAGELAQDLIALLDFLKIDQAVICGISVGGLIAQAAALDHPQRVRALILSDTGARIGSVESWQQRIDRVRDSSVEALVPMTMERWFSAGFRERCSADVRGYAIMLRQSSVEGYVGVCAALRDADLRQAMTQVKVPTLVLCGAEDIATPPDLGRELAGLIPGAQFSLIEKAAHLPCVEQPEVFVQRMVKFFQEVHIV
ncbi:MAG TPA: 3-oxoadipate enol-lactonase [Terriglobales bacterium]|jgi:3-oxoadipate enol-lactonase|nr:3-oxoadipate enol-lactonase [Terriglobales bacterium]